MYGSEPGTYGRLDESQPYPLLNVHKIIPIDARDKISLKYSTTVSSDLESLCYSLLFSLDKPYFQALESISKKNKSYNRSKLTPLPTWAHE